MLGWRKQTLGAMRQAYQAYAAHLAREMDPATKVKEGQRVREDLWMTVRRVKGLGGWLGQFEKPEEVLERYPAMKPFLKGQAYDLQRPWRYPENPKPMPKVVLKWLPMVSMWETERLRRVVEPKPWTWSSLPTPTNPLQQQIVTAFQGGLIDEAQVRRLLRLP